MRLRALSAMRRRMEWLAAEFRWRVEISGVEPPQGKGELVADFVVWATMVAFDAEDVVAAFFHDISGAGRWVPMASMVTTAPLGLSISSSP